MKINRREISKSITRLENREEGVFSDLEEIFSPTSFRKTVCFTGPAGVGKSSFLAQLSKIMGERQSLCWLACDPSSPISGGSLLGDRIRVSGQEVSEQVFIRSLSTRSQSAFSKAIRDIQIYLENYFDQVWVETAGTGQTQSDVSLISGLTVLILQPETGDEVQWMKSGLRECADIFVINKSDLPGADSMLESLIEFGAPKERVFLVSSKNRQGIREFSDALLEIQKEFDWKPRLKKMHEDLAHSLFVELYQRRMEKEFKKSSSKWFQNPYRQASSFFGS